MSHEICRILAFVEDEDYEAYWGDGEDFLRDYCGSIFDYFQKGKTKDAPDGMILGSKNPRLLMQTLQDIKALQKLTADAKWKQLSGKANAILANGTEYLEKGCIQRSDENACGELASYMKLISGRFSEDILFFDTEAHNAFVDLNKVAAAPEDWGLFIFDVHC